MSYTPPEGDTVDFSLSSYSGVEGDDVLFEFYESGAGIVYPTVDSSSSIKQSNRVVSTGPNTGRVETMSGFSFTPTQSSYIKSFSVMARGDEVGDSTVTATINGVTSNSVNVGNTTSNFLYRKFEFATPVKVEVVETQVSFNITGSWLVLFGVLENSGWNITYNP